MATKDIITKNIFPLNKEDHDKWDAFIQSLDETILWFPDSQSRFHILNWFSVDDPEVYPIPSVCIYTDHLPYESLNDLITGDTLEFEDHRVVVRDVIPLSTDWDYTLRYEHLHPLHRSAMSLLYGDNLHGFPQTEPGEGIDAILTPITDEQFIQKISLFNGEEQVEKTYLFRVSIEYEVDALEDNPEIATYDTYILYFCHEKIEFFKKFIVEEGLKLSYLVSLNRESMNYIPTRLFEYLLGFMGVEYLITRFERGPQLILNQFLNNPMFSELINHSDNKRYILNEIAGYEFYETIYKANYTN